MSVDLPCLRCAYNLRGLTDADACPECNLPASRSLMGDFAAHAPPRHRSLLHAGLGLCLLGALLWEARLAALILMLLANPAGNNSGWFLWLELLLGVAAAAACTAGIVCATARDPSSPVRRASGRIWAARLAFGAALLGEAGLSASVLLESSPASLWAGGLLEAAFIALMIVLTLAPIILIVAWVVAPILAADLLRALAMRLADVPSRRLAAVLRWLFPLLVVGTPFFMWGGAAMGGDRLIGLIPLTILAGLGVLWAVLLNALRRGAAATLARRPLRS